MKELLYVNFIIGILFAVFYSYHLVYILVALAKKPKVFTPKTEHKLAVIVSARNEEEVLPQLIESIRWQKYPKKLLDIFVVADNCTDRTAAVARELGCIVYERQNKELVGKGYALDYLFSEIHKNHADAGYEGYIVFDADNIADENYVAEMNKVFDSGYQVIASYRNTKNFADNWISAGYALWFLQDAKFMNNPRMTLGVSCSVTGTGFLVSEKVIQENGGWKFFTLTEDFEFTMDRILKDDKIGYAENAIFYDEQPTELGQSITQRSRWVKGFMQVLKKDSRKLAKKIVFDGSFAIFDMIVNVAPSCVLAVVGAVLNVILFVFGIVTGQDMNVFVYTMTAALVSTYFFFCATAALTAIVERKRIQAESTRLAKMVLLFPLFMATYIPAILVALFTDVTWTPIKHKVTLVAESMKKSDKSNL